MLISDYLQIKEDIAKKERARLRNFKQVVRLLNEKDRDEYYNEHLQKLLGNTTLARKRRSTEEGNSKNSSKINTVQKTRKKRRRLSKEERKKRREERKRRKNKKKGKKGKGKRALDFRYNRKRRSCAKHEMYVDFDEMDGQGGLYPQKVTTLITVKEPALFLWDRVKNLQIMQQFKALSTLLKWATMFPRRVVYPTNYTRSVFFTLMTMKMLSSNSTTTWSQQVVDVTETSAGNRTSAYHSESCTGQTIRQVSLQMTYLQCFSVRMRGKKADTEFK